MTIYREQRCLPAPWTLVRAIGVLLAALLLAGCLEEGSGSQSAFNQSPPLTPGGGSGSGGLGGSGETGGSGGSVGSGGSSGSGGGTGGSNAVSGQPQNVTLSWLAPLDRVDGSPLTNLAGFKIYYGNSPSNLDHTIVVDQGISLYVVEHLDPGVWYFAMTAFDSEGLESNPTNLVFTELK